MADSMFDKIKSNFSYEEPKTKTPVKDLDQKKAKDMAGVFNQESSFDTALSRRMDQLKNMVK